jgi:putative endonuclease
VAPCPASKTYTIYIRVSGSRTPYVGVTSDLKGRVWQQKEGEMEGATWRYHVDRLVYSEVFGDVQGAIAREKQLKRRELRGKS